MSAMRRGCLAALLVGTAVLAAGAWLYRPRQPANAEAPHGVVLIDAAPLDDDQRAVLQAWTEATHEEGFQVAPMRADDIERGGLSTALRGVILPDSAALRLGERTVAELHRYVRDGGRLLVSFDAGTLRAEDGSYSPLRSRLSDLVGIDYAPYQQLRAGILARDAVDVTAAGLVALAVQPGKTEATATGQELKTYGYRQLTVPMFKTAGDYHGEVLAASPHGDVVVGRSKVGRGEVLFVNAPVGYLKTRSDGYLLHQSLRLFMGSMLREPQLLAVPDGIGGVVMNVHVDSNAAIAPLQSLEAAGVFNEGPWSLHFTTGPDTYRPGDHAGLDLDHNEWARDFVLRMRARGHEIGSHGGWSHNEFGLEVNDQNEARFEPYLAYNADSLQRVTGDAPRVYSAPVGNQPLWTNRWLQSRGFVAYYDTGGAGLGPTRAWRDGRRADSTLWSFPVANFGSIATFEELDERDDDPSHAGQLAQYREFAPRLIDFTARERVVRLAYFHAPAGARHLDVVNAWIARAQRAGAQGRFRWYRMEDLARFMDRREQVQWSWRDGALSAQHPQSLSGMAWLLRGTNAARLRVTQGQARIESSDDGVLIHVTGGQSLLVTAIGSGDKAP